MNNKREKRRGFEITMLSIDWKNYEPTAYYVPSG